MGLFEEDSERSAWVVARNKCEVAEINYEQFRRLADQSPEILFALTTQLAARLRKTSTKVRDLAFLDVTGRVASTLLDLAKQPDSITHPDGMQIRITRRSKIESPFSLRWVIFFGFVFCFSLCLVVLERRSHLSAGLSL